MLIDYEKIKNIISVEIETTLNNLVASSLNDYLDKLRDILDQEQKIIQETASKTVEKINQPIEILNTLEKKMSALQNTLFDLETENKKLIDEIRKRDAIIERKTKQIARLKEKNGI
jgi:uncharacterized phage infection (PIP) family protein YhgE